MGMDTISAKMIWKAMGNRQEKSSGPKEGTIVDPIGDKCAEGNDTPSMQISKPRVGCFAALGYVRGGAVSRLGDCRVKGGERGGSGRAGSWRRGKRPAGREGTRAMKDADGPW